MFKKNNTYASGDLDKLRKSLENILSEFKEESPEKILKFSHQELSDYFKDIKIALLEKRKKNSTFPSKSTDYIIIKGGAKTYNRNLMIDSFPLFYMDGIYRTRDNYYEDEYFGIKLKSGIAPAAYIRRKTSGNYKVYLNYDVVKNINYENFRKLIAATSIRLGDYKSDSYFN